MTEFSQGISPNVVLEGIALGPDGNVWFVESETRAGGIGRIGRISFPGTNPIATPTLTGWPKFVLIGLLVVSGALLAKRSSVA